MPESAREADGLIGDVYEELRRIAATHMRREGQGHTLQPTALVHEAYLRLADRSPSDWNDRRHFLALGAIAVRRVLIDHARRVKSDRRGGDQARVTLVEGLLVGEREQELDVLALDEALQRLAEECPRQAQVVELRYFGGLTVPEVAEQLDTTTRTIERDWRAARAWLLVELAGSDEDGAGA